MEEGGGRREEEEIGSVQKGAGRPYDTGLGWTLPGQTDTKGHTGGRRRGA